MKIARKIFIAMLTVVLIISNFSGSMITVKAAEKPTGIVFVGTVEDVKGVPGETVHVKLPIRAVNGYIMEPRITVKTESMPFTVQNIKYTTEGDSTFGLSYFSTTYIEFDLKVKETAEIGTNKLIVEISFTYQDNDGNVVNDTLQVPSVNFIISEEKEAAQLTLDNIEMNNAVIGSDTTLSFTIKNEGGITAHNAYFTISGYDEAKIIPTYSKMEQKIGSATKLAPGDSYRVELPVTISPDATVGPKNLTVNMSFKDEDGNADTNTRQIYVTLESNTMAPKIEIVSTKNPSELKAGDSFNLVTTLRNAGDSTAKNIKVLVEGLGVSSFLPGYTTKTLAVSNIKNGDKLDVKIPLIVSNEAAPGLKEVPITITYEDAAGVEIKAETTLYLEIFTADGVDVDGKPNVVIGNVSQSPEAPNSGARVDASFDLENKSNVDISQIKISLVNATGASFAPLNNEPYQYIEELKGGRKTRITIPVMASDTITEGTNGIDIKFEYKDANGNSFENTATIYILNVQNDGVGASKPKLIISDFTTDVEELRAGNTFNFNFDIKNTHSNVDARNIKVTVSQADNIFSVAKGSNTFYITNIPAGETVQNILELKVKSDATTKAYPIEITMEYEYEGAEPNTATGEIGETVKETINLQAVENSRPVVDNIVIGSWDVPVVNQSTVLTFEFYNMGKSALNNVHATVEGDYYLSTGNMYFLGNIEAGMQEYVELEVIPTVEGQAMGTLTVTFEDSNGDEVSITKEFEGNVQGEYIPDMTDGEFPDMGFGVEQAKAAILPTWLFIIIQIAILAVMIPVTRKVILQLYRNKLRKQEEAE